jgi:uracil-DNA glycosylase
MPTSWDEILEPLWSGEIGRSLRHNLATEPHYPPQAQIMRALHLTPFEQVRVVILGQDPYHRGQADGLAFSVREGLPLPGSLRNIWKELARDQGLTPLLDALGRPIGSLEGWAKQGVLLLNTHLTVHPHMAGSHSGWGWETITDALLRALEEQDRHVYLLWGAHARRKKVLLNDRSVALEAPHPSPLSAHRGFIGCGHFSETNRILGSWGQQEINWQDHA